MNVASVVAAAAAVVVLVLRDLKMIPRVPQPVIPRRNY